MGLLSWLGHLGETNSWEDDMQAGIDKSYGQALEDLERVNFHLHRWGHPGMDPPRRFVLTDFWDKVRNDGF